MVFEGCHVTFEFSTSDEALAHKPVSNIIDEVSKDGPPFVARRVNMDDCVDVNVDNAGITKQPVRASPHEEINALRCRVCLVCVQQTGQRGQRRIVGRLMKSASKLATQPPGRTRDTISRTILSGCGTFTRTSRMCAPSNDPRANPVSYASPSRTSTCVSAWPATKRRANSTK